MLRELNGFELPDDTSKKVWRYITLEKLESLLKDRSLYFAGANEFKDSLEGSISDVEFKRQFTLDPAKISDEELELMKKYHRHNRFGHHEAFKALLRLTKINCWHVNEHESDAMWHVYTGQEKGIAIQSTIKNLTCSLQEYKIKPEYGAETMWVGMVKYIDYSKESMDASDLARFFYRRIHFLHENELRVAISLCMAVENAAEIPELGIYVPVDINTLVEKIYISPILDNNIAARVNDLVKKYRYTFSVIHSGMKKSPVY